MDAQEIPQDHEPMDQYIDSIHFTKLKDYIRPLDLLVFQGKTFVEKWILMAQLNQLNIGNWTHVGVVFPSELIPFANRKEGELYIWESVISGWLSDGVPSVETNRAYFGVQIRSLKDVLAANQASGSNIGILRLANNPLQPQKGNESEQQYKGRMAMCADVLHDIMERYHGRPFDCNICNCLTAVYPIFFHFSTGAFKHTQERAFFCSEFVTFLYQRLGLIPRHVNPQLITPQELISCTGDLAGVVKYEDMWEDTIYLIQNVADDDDDEDDGDGHHRRRRGHARNSHEDGAISIRQSHLHLGRKERWAMDNQYRVQLDKPTAVAVQPQKETAAQYFQRLNMQEKEVKSSDGSAISLVLQTAKSSKQE